MGYKRRNDWGKEENRACGNAYSVDTKTDSGRKPMRWHQLSPTIGILSKEEGRRWSLNPYLKRGNMSVYERVQTIG